jgi:hypothetical protein
MMARPRSNDRRVEVWMPADIVCFAHLPWDLVYQRPNHLMARAARTRRVLYVQEPVADDGSPGVEWRERDGVEVVIPHVPPGLEAQEREQVVRLLVESIVRTTGIVRPVLWFYTPMALPLSVGLPRSLVVYDSMDDLSGFAYAPRGVQFLEARLLQEADVVFTGGRGLQRRIAGQRPDAICLPSSVDREHFARARHAREAPELARLPRPRFGYLGVVDERLDLGLVAALADAHARGSVVLVGPRAKIPRSALPSAPNIAVLGSRPYADLPAYLAGFDVGIMPFAHNDATRWISPTKTPEYLAAGLPVASTSIRDVVADYGEPGLVEIGDGPDGFIDACRRALGTNLVAHRARADARLRAMSWDATWAVMDSQIAAAEGRDGALAAGSAVTAALSVSVSAGRDGAA